MFATTARVVPESAFAWRELSFTLNSSRFSIFSTFTRVESFWVSVPSVPLTEIWSWPMVTSTFSGRTTGLLPILDMSCSPGLLRHEAEDFAADAETPRLAVGHHALGRR